MINYQSKTPQFLRKRHVYPPYSSFLLKFIISWMNKQPRNIFRKMRKLLKSSMEDSLFSPRNIYMNSGEWRCINIRQLYINRSVQTVSKSAGHHCGHHQKHIYLLILPFHLEEWNKSSLGVRKTSLCHLSFSPPLSQTTPVALKSLICHVSGSINKVQVHRADGFQNER